jgi:glycosyltransferase involved in cell wall biosynthesis
MQDAAQAAPPDLSVVVPVHDEAGNLRPLWEEIRAALERVPGRAEVIFVNDGSTDGSGAVLDALRAGDARIRVLDHDRNHGLTAALDCGFAHARAPVVAMLDADGQNPPGEIPKLLEALAGCDMVIGWRRDRRDPWLKRVSSKIANAYRNRRTHEQVHDTGCGLKVFRRRILEKVKLWNGMHRFLPTLARMEGFTVREVVVAHRPRGSGRSHYGVWNRVWKGLRDVRTIRWMWRNRLQWKATERPPIAGDAPPTPPASGAR